MYHDATFYRARIESVAANARVAALLRPNSRAARDSAALALWMIQDYRARFCARAN